MASVNADEERRYRRRGDVVVTAQRVHEPVDVETPEGTLHANPGDFIITGVDGRKYPVRGNLFPVLYTSVENEAWHLELNGYQRDNLLWLLNCVGYPWDAGPVSPFTEANTGDWVGEIALMLAGTDGELTPPKGRTNMSTEDLRERIKRWVETERRGS